MLEKIQPILQPKPYSHPYGDLLSEQNEWVRCIKDIEEELGTKYTPILLDYIHLNSWKALYKLNVLDYALLANLQKNSEYICPYTDNTYVSMVPTLLLAKDPDLYLTKGLISPSVKEMACNKEWNMSNYEDIILDGELSRIQLLLLGSGYTQMTLISDGSTSIESVMVDLNNGDKLVFAAYLWHNK